MYITEISKENYSRFVEVAKNSTVFHKTPWLDIVAEVYGSKMLYLGVIESERLVGVLPVMCKRFWGLMLYGSPLPQHATHMTHPVLDGAVESAAFFMAIQNWVKEHRIAFFQLAWTGKYPNMSRTVLAEPRTTLVISLEGTLDKIWKHLKSEVRNRIRRTIRAGVKLHWRSTPRFLPWYQELLHSTYTRQGLAPNFPPGIYAAILRHREQVSLKLLTATHHGKPIAALWVLVDQATCYFWDGASDQQYRQFSANHLLHWEIIRWAHKHKRVAYDLVGAAGRGGAREGIERFKRSLGAVPVNSSMIYWTRWWVRLLLKAYRLYLRRKDKPKK